MQWYLDALYINHGYYFFAPDDAAQNRDEDNGTHHRPADHGNAVQPPLARDVLELRFSVVDLTRDQGLHIRHRALFDLGRMHLVDEVLEGCGQPDSGCGEIGFDLRPAPMGRLVGHDAPVHGSCMR